jgi:hypothetical protein
MVMDEGAPALLQRWVSGKIALAEATAATLDAVAEATAAADPALPAPSPESAAAADQSTQP